MDFLDETKNENCECKVSYFWKGLALFLLGVILGIILAPVKNGVSIGNNNNIVGGKDDDDDCCEDYCDDDEDYKF